MLLPVLLTACAANSSGVLGNTGNGRMAGPPLALTALWPLQRSGPPTEDSTVRFGLRQGRRVVLRQGEPDYALFLLLNFPGDSLAAATDSLTLAIRPLPGQYGVELTANGQFPEGSTATFSYAIHFVQPGESVSRYPTPVRFDQALGAVLVIDSLRGRFLRSSRPASDLLTFPLTRAGVYLLAAAK